jgi:cytochrome c oxidase subunit 1
LSGVMHSSPPADLQQTDTYFVVAHFHYVLFGGAMFGIFAGIYYWWPKAFGRKLGENFGKTHFWLTFIGANLTFFPMHLIGLLGMPRRIYTYDPALGLDSMNMVATIGAFILAVSALVFMVNVLYSRRRGEPAAANPWDAATLEWAVPSPPPAYNFTVLPEVRSRLPLWSTDGMTPTPLPADPPEPVHVPGGSFWPLVTATAIVAIAVGGILESLLVVLGAGLALVICVYAWAFEPFEV